MQLQVYEVGVRWSSACEDMGPGAEEHPLLEDVTSSAVKTVTGNTILRECTKKKNRCVLTVTRIIK
jgi:hypothetical protein